MQELFTTQDLVLAMAIALSMGVAIGLLLRAPIAVGFEDDAEEEDVPARPLRFDGRVMTEKQRDRLRQFNPAYARVEDTRIAADEHAEQIRAKAFEGVDEVARKVGAV